MLRILEAVGRPILATAVAVSLFGCGETTEPTADAPELPPVESMRMDLSFFNDSGAGSGPGNGVTGSAAEPAGLKLNFLNAAVRAAYVNVAVVTILAPPSLAFAAALHTIPSEDSGSYWWIYTWIDHGQDHQIRLRGTPDGDHVDWELYVALPGEDAELWFSGRSFTDRDEGWWIFRDFTADGDPEVLRIDWNMASETDATLTFLNIHDGHEEEGDELRYRADGSLRSIEFTDVSDGEIWDIIWDEADGSGSLRFPDYNDGERACWDSNQEDAVCGAAAAAFLSKD